MKKTIALLAAICTLNVAMAQDQLTNPNAASSPTRGQKATPEMLAGRHSKHLEKMLGLTPEQTQKTYDALVTRFTEVKAVKDKIGPNGDKKAMHEQIKPIRQKFVATMTSILTPEQKAKWDAHRQEMKKNRAMRKDDKGNPPPASGNGDIKKLTDDDDGMED